MRIDCLRAMVLLLAIAVPRASLSGGMPQAVQPIPRGRTAANDATRQAEKVEPPVEQRRSVSAGELQKQANELLALAQQVHDDTERAAQGVLDKDLKDRLRRIEKLAKKLRDELEL